MQHKISSSLKSIIVFAFILLCSLNAFAATVTNTKTVLVTGGASGIGKDIATEFQKEGWNVWITTRDTSKHEAIPGIEARKVDITDPKQVQALIADIKTKTGRLDVVVNNAGYGILGPQEALSVQQAKDMLYVNVIGPLVVTQESLPLLRASRGHIINISSTSGLRAIPGLGLYSASKMALEGMSEALAAELTPWHIKVTIIEPGTVNNDWVKNSQEVDNIHKYPSYKGFTERLRKNLTSKAKEMGQDPHEIAKLAVTIAKDPRPNLRYQTSSQAIGIANEVLSDPSGNNMRDKMALMAKDLYELPG